MYLWNTKLNCWCKDGQKPEVTEDLAEEIATNEEPTKDEIIFAIKVQTSNKARTDNVPSEILMKDLETAVELLLANIWETRVEYEDRSKGCR
jgi:hypothetical protein